MSTGRTPTVAIARPASFAFSGISIALFVSLFTLGDDEPPLSKARVRMGGVGVRGSKMFFMAI